MPVKWTAERDQLLLLKILETHDLKLDPKKVVAAWPSDEKDKPTPRAITERLVRIRQNIKTTSEKANAGTKLTIVSGQNSAVTTPSKPAKPFAISTPVSSKRKREAQTNTAQRTGAGTGTPVKKEIDMDRTSDIENENDEPATPSKKGKARNLHDIPAFSATPSPYSIGLGQDYSNVPVGSSLGLGLSSTLVDDGSVLGGDTPVKRETSRPRRASTKYGMVEYGDRLGEEDSEGEEDDEVDSSASEFVDYNAGNGGDEDDDFA